MCENFVALAIKPLFFLRNSVTFLASTTLGTRGFSRVRREVSVLAEGRHVFGRRPKPQAAKPREKPLVPRVVEAKNVTEFRKKK